jgi:hypothetical protein
MDKRYTLILAVAVLVLASVMSACKPAPPSSEPEIESDEGDEEIEEGPYPEINAEDNYYTVGGGTLTFGQPVTDTLSELDDAHNWAFEGSAGQTVTISVTGEGECDPQVTLLDLDNNVLAADDDGGGGNNALLTYTLPADGTYIARVDVWEEGQYTITVE